jgi:hypothetical protein
MKLFFLLSSAIFHLVFIYLQIDESEVPRVEEIKIKLTQTKKISSNQAKKQKYNKDLEKLTAFNQTLLNASKAGFVKDLDISREGTLVDDLYEKINAGLTFPTTFQRFSIQGAVKAKVYFDRDGFFKINESLFTSKNGFLRFHIMSYLKSTLKDYILKTSQVGGFIPMTFLFRYTVSGLQKKVFLNRDSFYFEREAFQAETKTAKALLEVGQTLISLLNLLKFRPDFLRTNSELQKEQGDLNYLNRIRSHPYYK